VCHPDPDPLPAGEPDPQVVAHLASCPQCRGQLASLSRTFELARDDVGAGPPARVWRAIADELGDPARRRRRRPAALAVALAVAAGVVAGYVGGHVAVEPAATAVATLAPIDLQDATTSGRASMLGANRMEVVLDGGGDLAGPGYLEVWLVDRTATRMVAVGALTRDGERYRGAFTLPDSLPVEVFPTVVVSVESWDGDPGHSGHSVLRGTIA
jgi:Anti-sigma-K factor rskA